MSSRTLRSAAGVALALAATAAQAAVLEEILVTAQKRQESLQDVPISVNVILGENIRSANLSDLQDLTDYVPNVTIAEGGANDNLYIRGIGSGQNQGFEQSVGTFIDGVYFGRGRHSRAQFLDIERVEVLRGPQSTYFGNSAIAGAFNVTTRRPGEEWEGYVNALYEFELEEREVEFAVGGPVHSTLGVRLAGRFAGIDGWIENRFTGEDEAEESSRQGRLTVVWQPTDNFEAILKNEVATFEVDGEPTEAVACPPKFGVAPQLSCGFILNGIGPTGVDVDLDKESGGASPPPPFGPAPAFFGPTFQDTNLSSHALTMNLDWAGYRLTSVTAFVRSEDNEAIDPDQGPFGLLNVRRDEDYQQWSQELRITSPSDQAIEWMAGVYYQQSDLSFDVLFSPNLFLPLPPPPAGPGPIVFAGTSVRNFDQAEESIAVFGSATWHARDYLRLILGFRWSEVDKSATNAITLTSFGGGPPSMGAVIGFAGPFETTPGVTVGSRSDDDFTPDVTVEWDINQDVMTYFRFAQGFKAGGFNSDFEAADPTTFQFAPEQVDAFEIGAKTSWLGGALRVNLALFRSEYTDLQVAIFDSSTTNFITTNAAEAVSQGIELESQWQITERWSAQAAFSWLDGFYDDFEGAECTEFQKLGVTPGCDLATQTQDLTDEDLQFAPDWSGSLRVLYEHAFTNGLALGANLSLVFTDDYFTTLDNDPELAPDSHARLDARVALGQPGRGWEVAFVGRNLLDKRTFAAGDDLPASPGSFLRLPIRPRQLAIQASYEW